MAETELIKGYQAEIAYQKHMIENLGRWGTLLFVIASVGLVLIYFFYKTNFAITIFGFVLSVVGALWMLLFGYGIYKGKRNINKVIDAFESKLH